MKKLNLSLFVQLMTISLIGCDDDNGLVIKDDDAVHIESCSQSISTRSGLTFETDWEKMDYVTRTNGKNEMLPWNIRANTPVDYAILCDMKK